MTTTFRSLLLALIMALLGSACDSTPPTADSIYEGGPSRYGSDSTSGSNRYGAGSSRFEEDSAERSRARQEARNRFGYGEEANDDDTADTPPPATRERADRRRDRVVGTEESDSSAVAETSTTPKPEDKPEPKPAPKPSGQPSVGEMPYAKGVPGNPLAVTVPGYDYVGQVSIEKLDKNGNPSGEPQAPGTAVQIPDPKNPGKTIYFRVP